MKTFRKNIRLKNYDYSQDGAYFITICTDTKKPLINKVNKLIIENELKTLENTFPGLHLDFYSIMPNHIHFILIFNEMKKSLPEVLRVFKSKTTVIIKRSGYQGKYFWQKNYYEHVIRNENGLQKIREYILNNPLAEEIKWENIYNHSITSDVAADLGIHETVVADLGRQLGRASSTTTKPNEK
jgi:REP element-mobilizing transposase RayT